jgi:hypothetical protein
MNNNNINFEQNQEVLENNSKLIYSPKFIPFYPELTNLGLSTIAILIYGFIDFYLSTSPENKFYFSNEQLIDLFKIGRTTLIKAIKELTEKNLIITNYSIKQGGGKIRFIQLCSKEKFFLSEKENFNLDGQIKETQRSKSELLTFKKRTSDVQKMNENNNNINKNNIYIKEKKKIIKEKKKRENLNNSNLQEIQEIVNYYNQIFNKKTKSFISFEKNFLFWRQTYTVEEIKQAIKNAKQDKFWSDKLTLTILFRQKNPRGEAVDYIQDFLNTGKNFIEEQKQENLKKEQEKINAITDVNTEKAIFITSFFDKKYGKEKWTYNLFESQKSDKILISTTDWDEAEEAYNNFRPLEVVE